MSRRTHGSVRTSAAIGVGAVASWLAQRALRRPTDGENTHRENTHRENAAHRAPVSPRRPDPSSRTEVEAAMRRAAVELHRRGTFEALAGLPDRSVLERELARRDRPTSVVMADLGGFGLDADSDDRSADAIAANDEVRRQVRERLRSIVRSDTAVHHLGSDEFVIVVDGDRYVADAIARRITDAFSQPFSVRGVDLVLAINMGIAEVADDDEPSDVVHRADLARFRAARSGGGVALAPSGPRGRSSER